MLQKFAEIAYIVSLLDYYFQGLLLTPSHNSISPPVSLSCFRVNYSLPGYQAMLLMLCHPALKTDHLRHYLPPLCPTLRAYQGKRNRPTDSNPQHHNWLNSFGDITFSNPGHR